MASPALETQTAYPDIVATSPLTLCWMCNSSRMGCAQRTTPIYMRHEQAIIKWLWLGISANTNLWMIEHNVYHMQRVILLCALYCCLLPQYEALRTCHSGIRIATQPSTLFSKGSMCINFPLPWSLLLDRKWKKAWWIDFGSLVQRPKPGTQQLWTPLLKTTTKTEPFRQALQQQRLRLQNAKNAMTLTITAFNQ